MGMSAEGESGQADTGRAEAFSDGVIAIIITLLVLDLRPPGGEPGGLLRGLLRQWPTYLAYVTSYVYVGVVWLNHKAMFRRIRSIDRGLHWANFGILFTTALSAVRDRGPRPCRGARQPGRRADGGRAYAWSAPCVRAGGRSSTT